MKSFLAAGLFVMVLLQQTAFTQNTDKPNTGDNATPPIQNTAPSENIFTYKPRWGVGLQAGLLSGIGLGVRYHPVSRFSLQIVGGGIKIKDDFNYSFGGEGQFDLDLMESSRLYALVGLGVYANGKSGDDKLKAPVRIGAGIGYEGAVSSKMVFYGSVAFTYFLDSKDFWPAPQFGMFYYFK